MLRQETMNQIHKGVAEVGLKGKYFLLLIQVTPKRAEVTGGWRKLHNEELHNLYCSPITIRMTKSRRMRWAGHVARTGENRNAYRILV
jgi:hypothetical protein